MRTLRQTLVVATLVALAVSVAAAQTFTGGLRGSVKDANGVIPGVTVTLLNEATGQGREAVANESGEFNFAAVPPGTYTVRAALTGFKSYENKGVRIAAQQFITLDITLEVGQLEETVTVTGQAPLIDTSTASTGAVIDTQQLQTLPSGGRSAFLFAVTVPTVVASGDAQFNRQQDQTNASLLSLGGGTRRGNNYMIDGVPITDFRNRASANPTIEALEDVAVQVHTYDAETGRTGGGTFNVATKSGTNDWHGSGFYQGRPRWGQANNFFSERAGVPLPETYFHLGGGSFGGPVIKNRTFFWFATEGYGSNTTRNGSLRFPTTRERNGDFSQTFNSQGQLVVIYDPLTGDAQGNGRTPFPGNIIPANRINAVGRAVANTYPLPDTDISNGQNNFNRTAEINDRAIMYTGKMDHRFNDKLSLAGFYLYNKSNEPCAEYWEPGLTGEKKFADPNAYVLRRRIHVLALNNTWLPSNNTVVALRYGYTKFIDNDTLSADFNPSSLGFSSGYLSAQQVQKFPRFTVDEYDNVGALDPFNRNWYSWGLNGSVSKLLGKHTIKGGLDFRRIGLDGQSFANGAGDLRFDRFYTSANPLANGTAGSGNALAALMLGYPSGDPGNQSQITVSTPLNVFVNYFGGYIQDDYRINSKLTVNYGVRLERETGLMEQDNNFTVGFDRTLNPGGALGAVTNPLTGQPIRGGLIYAGQNGANTYQGDPLAVKFSPRVGAVYSLNPKTVLRAGYGIYWAPWNYPPPGAQNYGNIGYTRATFINQGQFRPTVTVDNPFPSGVLTPIGNSLGALTGVGGQIEFVDQDKRAPYVHQYSVDLNRELPGNIAVGFEYSGATGRDLGLGGTVDAVLNVNQVPTQYLSLGSALLDAVPNPFFGLPAGQGFNVTSPTVQRRQLLRPFPQFGDILMRQATQGRNQYHAAIFKFEKRMSNGWGGRINYTYSRLMDNQFGESNFFSRNSGEALDAYNVDAEWSRGLLDVPHKIVMSPIIELPFGEGKRWATGGIGKAILGRWTISSIISLESGFPLALTSNTNNTNLFTRTQRPDLTGGAITNDGNREDLFFPTGNWLTSTGTGAVVPAAFTLGNAPRTLADQRTPRRDNWDFVATKDVPFGKFRGQLRFEVLNITNTVKVRGPEYRVGRANYGVIDTQSGFMRLTQLMFRLQW